MKSGFLFTHRIAVIGGFLALSIAAGLLVRAFFLKEPQTTLEFPKLLPPFEKSGTLKETGLKSFSIEKELTVPLLPIPKPDPFYIAEIAKNKLLPSDTVSFFEKINESAKIAEESLASNNASLKNISTVTSDGIILSLTKEQFRFLYPDNFISGLINIQASFIKEYDSAYEPLSKIETDSQVRYVEEKIVAILLLNKMITKEKAEKFITTIRFTLPQLQLIDLKTYSPYSFYKSPLPQPAIFKGLFLAGLIEMATNALSDSAQAAVCGYCYDQPECYQSGISSPKIGTELIKFACFCTGCLSSLGCLSSCDEQPAIYDPTTGICGCG